MNYKNNINTPDELILTITDIVNLLKHGELISHNLNIYFNLFCNVYLCPNTNLLQKTQ